MSTNKENESVTISYKANVTVRAINTKTGKTTRRTQKHNAGFVVFFELIANSIAGKSVQDLMPRYIKGFAEDKNTSTIASYISYNNPIIAKNETTASVIFEFLIPYTQISETTPTKVLKLYNQTTPKATPFAEVDLGDDTFKGDGQTNQLVIWTITIGNATA